MITLTVFGCRSASTEAALSQLGDTFDVRMLTLEDLSRVPPAQYTLIDADAKLVPLVPEIKKWLESKPQHAKVILATEPEWRMGMLGLKIGATDVIYKPIDSNALLEKIWGELFALAGDPLKFPGRMNAPGVAAAADLLHNVFSTACFGSALEAKVISTACDSVIGELEAKGLHSWIDAVRTHHSQTYQHCLLVTGLAVSFGQRLGLSWMDRHRLSVAGVLHDIGKARIPINILEKPGPLDRDELKVMRRHPEYGLDAVAQVPSLGREMRDIVVHHHEYLDGSGYPHGLSGSEIPDLTRIITIADVFGALIEKRSYKPPHSNEDAYKILLDMGPKLDKDLVREFRACIETMVAA